MRIKKKLIKMGYCFLDSITTWGEIFIRLLIAVQLVPKWSSTADYCDFNFLSDGNFITTITAFIVLELNP
jgi:hypothetical protein